MSIVWVCFASDYDHYFDSGEYSSYLSAHALAAAGITRGMEGGTGEVLGYWVHCVEVLRGSRRGRLSGMTHTR